MDGILEYKYNTGHVQDVDTKKRIVTGSLAAFNEEVDNVGDIAEFGMFTKTVAERGPQGSNEIYFLNHHDWKQPHGKFSVLQEKQDLLYFESNPLPNTSYSNDLIELYERGIIKNHSFGFITLKSKKDVDRGARRLKEVKLYEGSNVTIGADEKTPFLGFKSGLKEIEEKSSLIYKAIRNGTFTDETFSLLEIALKQLQTNAFELGKKALEKPDNMFTSKPEPLAIIKEFNKSLI